MYSILNDDEGNKTNVSDPLTVGQRRSGHFLSFIMTVHPDQDDPNCKYNRMTFRAFIKLPLDVGGIDASIDTHLLEKSHSSIPLGGFRQW